MDLALTKEVLYQLSYPSLNLFYEAFCSFVEKAILRRGAPVEYSPNHLEQHFPGVRTTLPVTGSSPKRWSKVSLIMREKLPP